MDLWDKLKKIQLEYEKENNYIWYVIECYILLECYDMRNLLDLEIMEFMKDVAYNKGSINIFNFDEEYCIRKFKFNCDKGILEILENNRELGTKIVPLDDIYRLYHQSIDLVFRLILEELDNIK